MVYSIRTLPIYATVYTVDGYMKNYTVVKFDGLLNIEEIYKPKMLNIGLISCDCPGNRWGKCKHRGLIFRFNFEDRTNKRWFYDLDNDRWYMPIRFR
jgi:hypothetical protein